MKKSQDDNLNENINWYNVAHQILIACKPLAERVKGEGVKLMLTDADKATVEGFGIVLARAQQEELLALCVAAGVDRQGLNALLDLHLFRKRS